MDGSVALDKDIRSLKEGEVITDNETGKKYRVKKSVLPASATGGPHGLGDPNDRALRRIEREALIPRMLKDRIEQIDCREALNGFGECMSKVKGFWAGKQCESQKEEFLRCRDERYRDPKILEEVTEAYLKKRALYRSTGHTENERKVDAFREWRSRHRGV